MKAHVIEDGVVVNTIVVDSLDFLPNLVEATAGNIGWSYTDGSFSPPPDTRTDEEKEDDNRIARNRLLDETDWMANSDLTMSDEMKTYRQALRDLPTHSNWPNLEDSDWPTKPQERTMSNARNIGDSAPVINFLDNVTSDVQTQLNTLDTAIGNVSVTSGSLTKTFAADETATVTLTGNVLAPVVTATKEVAQTGVTNNAWDAAAASYTLENSAPSTTLDFVGYDVSSASFVDNFSISAQETEPEGIAFNTDGTKMYVIGTTGDDVNEYTLSTGFDVSTATYSQNFDVSSQETEPKGIAFNTNGSKMFIVGTSGTDVNEYNLSTGFDVSTSSYSQNFSVSSQEASPQDVAFNTDGTKMFILGNTGVDVNEYTLSTGFDVSTASYSQNFSISGQESYPRGLTFNTDGTKMFVVGNSADKVSEYTLSTGFNVSTASYSQNFDVGAQDTVPRGIAFNASGTTMFILGSTGDDVNEYTIAPSSVTLGTGSFASGDVGKCIEANSGKLVLTSTGGAVTVTTTLSSYAQVASGSWQMYGAVYDSTADVLKPSGVAGAGFDISVGNYTGQNIASNQNKGIAFNNDGTKFYNLQAAGGIHSLLNEWSLSTAYDVSTATYVTQLSLYPQDTVGQDICFSTDGTRLFYVGSSNDQIHRYNLTTAWDLTTASYSTDYFSFSSATTIPTGICWSPDGMKLYMCEQQYCYVYQYNATSAFNVNGLSASTSFGPTTAYDTALEGVAISADGTKIFVVGQASDKVHEYSLPTAYSLTSAAYVQSFDVSSQTNAPTSVIFKSDGSEMWVCSDATGVYNYTTQSEITATGYQPAIASTIDSTYWTDLNSMTATNAVGDGNVFYALSSDGKTSWNILSNGTGATFVVTVAGGKFVIDGVSQDSLTLQEGQTYIFDQADATNGTHPLRLSTTSDGTHGGGTEYTTGVTTSGTPGSSGAYTQIVVAVGAPTLYYYCSAHSAMGGTITIGVTGVRKIVKNNGGTYQVNTNGTYGSETWANAATNTEVAALREAMTSASSVSGQYDVSTATFVDYFSVSAVGANSSYGFCFSATGHKMYVTSISLKSILEYDLSTNFDVSSASYTATFGVVAQDNSPADVQFNSDGTKMYVVGDSNNSVYEYALSTAWDVTSATLSSTFSIATYETDPWGLAFNSDGTKMFTIGVYGAVVEWALSTGFDISTASYTQNFATSGQLTYATGVEFNPDGTKMYVIDNGAQDVLTYTLTTGFDISTASFTARFLVTRGGLSKIRLNNDGTKMFLLNYSYLDVGEYTLGTTTYINQMTSTELNAVNDASQITLGTALDLATILYYASGQGTPTYSGTALNYDANVINQGAQLGVDYTYDAPAQNKVRITSVNAANLKIRVV